MCDKYRILQSKITYDLFESITTTYERLFKKLL